MLARWRQWRRRRVLQRESLPDEIWRRAMGDVPMARRYGPADQARLRDLVVLFLHEKRFEGAAGLVLTPAMKTSIALQACIPILNLGLDYYRGWVSIIVYPSTFARRHDGPDELGIVRVRGDRFAGESWERGPVVLSWSETRGWRGPANHAYSVVIHEMAHKLDLLDGAVNGMPALHPGMSAGQWQRDFGAAFDSLRAAVEQEAETSIDPYAAEDPSEFFAVLSEIFFETPRVLRDEYPALYGHLANYYRQDPAALAF